MVHATLAAIQAQLTGPKMVDAFRSQWNTDEGMRPPLRPRSQHATGMHPESQQGAGSIRADSEGKAAGKGSRKGRWQHATDGWEAKPRPWAKAAAWGQGAGAQHMAHTGAQQSPAAPASQWAGQRGG